MRHYVIIISSPLTGDRVVGPFSCERDAWDEWNVWHRPNLPKGCDARVMPALQPRLYGGEVQS